MIEPELAGKFIEQISRYTGYNINIMDGNGVIIASRDPSRIGMYHEAAYRIIQGSEDVVEVGSDDEYPDVRPGINLVIKNDRKREGVVGITGDPEEIRSTAMIIRMAIEAMLKYETQQEKNRQRRTSRDYFLQLLTRVEGADASELKSLSGQLNYAECPRFPVLCRIEEGSAEALARIIEKKREHGSQDLYTVFSDREVLLFRTVRSDSSDLRGQVRNDLADLLEDAEAQGIRVRFFVGSLQKSFSQYYYGTEHCRWLAAALSDPQPVSFFYDHIRAFFLSRIPAGDLQHAMNGAAAQIPEEERRDFAELIAILSETGYNLAEAARKTYVHKNTMLYRYRKLKERYYVDPVNVPADRAYCEYLRDYLAR